MAFLPEKNGGLFGQGMFSIDPNATPEQLKRKRDMLAAMMPKYGQARYTGAGLADLATGVVSGIKGRKMDKFEGERSKEATDIFNAALGGGPLSVLGMREPYGIGAPAPSQPYDGIPPQDQALADDTMRALGKPSIPNASPDVENISSYIMQSAAARGIDPKIALAVAKSEGLNANPAEGWQSNVVKNGKRERSYGPFQLYIDGGLGNQFMESTGLDPRDPSTWQKQVDFALDHASKNGWGSWYGARNTGIGNFQGIGGATVQNASYDPSQGGGMSSPMGGGGPDMQSLIQAASNPWLSPEQRQLVNGMIGQQQQRDQAIFAQNLAQSDPMYQARLEKAKIETDRVKSGAAPAGSTFSNLDMQARAAGLVPGTPEYQSFMLNGGGDPATFRALDLQAKAAGLEQGTPEYSEFMATRGAGLAAGAAQTAKNVADIGTGGTAAAAVDLGKASVAAGTAAWDSYGKLQTNIGNLDQAIAAIDNGAKSGLVYKMIPNVTEASASLENAMNRMGLDVVGSVTFGALSEGEMRLAMSTAVPQDLSPPELRNWLVKKRDAQQKASATLAAAAQFLTVPGNTINGWIEKNLGAKQGSGTFEEFAADPSAKAAADKYGVTLEEMWAIKQGQQ